jgi:hypothetical protein
MGRALPDVRIAFKTSGEARSAKCREPRIPNP